MALPDGVKRFDGAPRNPANIGSEGGSDAKIGSASANGDRDVRVDGVRDFNGRANLGASPASHKVGAPFVADTPYKSSCPAGIYTDVAPGAGKREAKDGNAGELD